MSQMRFLAPYDCTQSVINFVVIWLHRAAEGGPSWTKTSTDSYDLTVLSLVVHHPPVLVHFSSCPFALPFYIRCREKLGVHPFISTPAAPGGFIRRGGSPGPVQHRGSFRGFQFDPTAPHPHLSWQSHLSRGLYRRT